MTATAGAPLTRIINWKSIIWTTVEDHVNRLQLRIAKAIINSRIVNNNCLKGARAV